MRRALCFMIALTASAASTATVNDLVSIVRDAIQHRRSDSRTAGAVRKLELSERLDWRTVEELESEGAGPQTVSALEMLLDESQRMPAPAHPPEFASPANPGRAEQNRVLEAAARNSLNYSAGLPDFLCTETVRRYEDFKLKDKEDWKLKDTLTMRLSYFSHAEDYQLVAINGHPTFRTYEEVGGAVSEGEFGSLLTSIFRDAPRDRFAWDHWTTLRRRPAHVYRFHIGVEESTYNVNFAASYTQRPMMTRAGQSGFIYVDQATNRVLRILALADDIPADFPVTNVSDLVDYDFVDIAGTPFLLPIRALVRMGTTRVQTKNELAFEKYRKFTSDATITFH